MKTEINNDNKARFFFAYYGSTYHYSNEWGGFSNQVNDGNLHLGRDINNSAYLKLKPLLSLTDTEVSELASAYDITIGNHLLDSFDSIDDFRKNIAFADEHYCHAVGFFDFLRGRGYAIPWNGLTVEDLMAAKWIKLIES